MPVVIPPKPDNVPENNTFWYYQHKASWPNSVRPRAQWGTPIKIRETAYRNNAWRVYFDCYINPLYIHYAQACLASDFHRLFGTQKLLVANLIQTVTVNASINPMYKKISATGRRTAGGGWYNILLHIRALKATVAVSSQQANPQITTRSI